MKLHSNERKHLKTGVWSDPGDIYGRELKRGTWDLSLLPKSKLPNDVYGLNTHSPWVYGRKLMVGWFMVQIGLKHLGENF